MSAGSEGREFDWRDDADDVIVRSQPAIAIYPGPAGVVIRRQGDWCDDDDGVVWFGVDQAPAIAAAILETAGLDATALVPEPAPKPKDSTAAARQRRRRARQKEEATLDLGHVTAVTAVTAVTRDGEPA